MYYLGIDLGGTNIAIGLVDETGKILHKDSAPTGRERPYQDIIRDMAMLSLKVVGNAGANIKDIKSIGIGSPGVPDEKNGVLIYNNNLGFRNVPLREEMQKYIDLPVYIGNDANVAALAESVAGAAKDVEHSVTVTFGTGVGSGVVINKKVYSGFNFAASELGHMVIIADGEQCSCGRKGCWEAYASATALIRQTRRALEENPHSLIKSMINGDLSKIDAKTAFDAAKRGDEVGQRIVKQYIKYMAEGLANIVNIFMPQVIVIGGGVCKEGEYLLKPLRQMLEERAYTDKIPHPEIKIAQMGNDAGIVGAAMLGK